jgi:hypothetical protein
VKLQFFKPLQQMGAGLIKGNEYQNKSECSFLLGVYFDEELYDTIAQQLSSSPNMNNPDDITGPVITLDNFIHIINNEEINEKHIAILYKISLIGTGIRRILMNGGIAKQIIQILHHSHNTRAVEYAIGTLRNFSLDIEFRPELLELSLEQDWIRYLHEHNNSHTRMATASHTTLSPGTYEHLIAFLRNLSLDSTTIPILFNSGILKICQTILSLSSSTVDDWDASTQQNLAGLLWNLVSQEEWRDAVFESDILNHLLPFMESGTIFTQLNLTGIIFCLSVEKELAIPLFHTPQLMPTLINLFQNCVPRRLPPSPSHLTKFDSKTTQSSSPSSLLLSAPSPPISIIQEHLTGIFLAFSFYPELRVPLFKSQLTPLLFDFLVTSSSGDDEEDHVRSSSPSTSTSHPTLSEHSSQHCRDILLHLAQERSLRYELCEEWKRRKLIPSLVILLGTSSSSSLLFSSEEEEEERKDLVSVAQRKK